MSRLFLPREILRMDTARRWRPQGCPQQPGAHRACPSGQLAVVVAGPWRPACGARGPLLPTPFSPNAFFTQRLFHPTPLAGRLGAEGVTTQVPGIPGGLQRGVRVSRVSGCVKQPEKHRSSA
jgi:hypothetical protein